MIKICEYCKKKLLDILNKLIIHNLMIINKRKKEPFYLLDRKRKENSKKFQEYIYQDAKLYLDRKKKVFTSKI